jgi:putative pyoverdin transport system ATP-binding/permease protein
VSQRDGDGAASAERRASPASLLSLVTRGSWLTAAAAVGAGLVGGGASAALIALINTALHRPELSRAWLGGAFAGLVAAKVASSAVARLLLNGLAQRTMAELSRDLSRRVLATPLSRLESAGIPRVLAVLTDDVTTIGYAAQWAPALVLNLAVLCGCAIYLGWLSRSILLAVMVAVALGAVGYHLLTRRAYRYLQRARDTRDVLFRHFRALTEGMKELKLHAPRRRAFLSERIATAAEASRRAAVAGVRQLLVADATTQILFYGLLGALILVVPAGPGPDAERVTGYVLVTLYMMAPMWGVLDGWPLIARAQVSLEKVRDLGLLLAPTGDEGEPAAGSPAWRQLELTGVTFAYPSDIEGQAFTLGPLDLTLRRGEFVFLVGGNGSGKSTLVKVLTGLYSPQAGVISLDGRPITEGNREWYRQHFSVVFSDFFLFDGLLGLERTDLDARARRHLVELELDGKLTITDGALSTTALSQGQRKRLALLTAFLEDRPIYVFDEWAADQDPHYREIFYRRLLPELRALGKTLLVISHDDRYYGLADRVVKLEYGRLAEDRRPVPVV